ncbi:transglutaminase domain-containing protein [Tropicimonas sp. IMCC6043]|nr:transglutaminase domain-containing protein [Tropicimonas sp. IMCC6043]
MAGGKADLDSIASAIHKYVNQHALNMLTNVTYSQGGDGGQLWGLLPGGRTKGQCAEFSYLMEMMNRLLGIPALQKHIRAASTVQGIEKQLSYEGHTQSGDARFETRSCAHHGKEHLMMTFGYTRTSEAQKAEGWYRYAINEGEGTCEVNGKLYAGALDTVGETSGGRTPAHNILLACEKNYAPNYARSKATGFTKFDRDRFMIWVTATDSQGNYGVCEIDEADQIKAAKAKGIVLGTSQTPPFPPVPR